MILSAASQVKPAEINLPRAYMRCSISPSRYQQTYAIACPNSGNGYSLAQTVKGEHRVFFKVQ